jgi:hypothetical protein
MNTNSYIEEIDGNLDHLNQLRKFATDAKARRAEILKAAQETQEYKEADAAAKETDTMIEAMEKSIREMSLAAHDLMAELPERVTVKMFNVVSIPDELKAKEWCIQHFTPALKLDAKVFEKAAKDGNIPADLATVTKEARAQIATNLDK